MNNKAAAISDFKKCLKYDPENADAIANIRELSNQ
jgi:hypothetical protein